MDDAKREKIISQWPNDLGFDSDREEHVPIELPVQGTIPTWAAGVLYRNGPGANHLKNDKGDTIWKASHWFDGFGQLHRFEIKLDATIPGGVRVFYNSRSNVDSLMQSIAKTGKFDGYTFGQKRDPCESLFGKVKCLFIPTPKLSADFTNTAITVSANSVGVVKSVNIDRDHTKESLLIARTDEANVKTLDPQTLEPIGIAHQRQLHPLLTGPMSASHAKSDPENGDVFNFNLDMGLKATYRIFRTSALTGETDILATIASNDIPPAYMHSFFLTKNFVILCIWNAHLAGGGIKVLWEKNILDALMPFDESKPVKWLVIDRRHGRGLVESYESPAMYCFHSINAWEEEVPTEETSSDRKHQTEKHVNIHCDLLQYENLNILHRFYYDNLRSSSESAKEIALNQTSKDLPHFVRYLLPRVPLYTANTNTSNVNSSASSKPTSSELRALSNPGTATVVKEVSAHDSGDVPTMNNAYATKPYRYFYCCITRGRSTFMEEIGKVDTLTGTTVIWDHEDGHTPGEAIFVARPGTEGEARDEDDGVLLSVILDGHRGTSYLVCIDAKTMKELGRANLDGPIAFGFHGQFVPKEGGVVLDV